MFVLQFFSNGTETEYPKLTISRDCSNSPNTKHDSNFKGEKNAIKK